MEKKTTFVQTRLEPRDVEVLDALCNRPGQPKLSRSQVVRWLIRRAAPESGMEVEQ